MVLSFYVPRDEYGCLSNASLHGFTVDGRYWPTVEHYFQAQKFAGTEHEERVRLAATPGLAKEMGRDWRLPLRPDWESVKDDVMRRAVLRKFETHADIREILLATGDEEIVEKSTSDYYWGCGAEGVGRNMLGKILMETRALLRSRG
ncbi:NADAR family protein [Sorangium cellulosum]|uniref:Swarming motility protein ybiA n=1 Tax=Sorangium cellulosum TaxID=56 RepID=A0A150QRT0_SORCE|nr:NADAR family protein [Sorangium cellulosum]KYF70376.1 Swarming motility protein ybiA [Sorangium cellulosum]